MKSSNVRCQTDPVEKELAGAEASNEKEGGEKEKKKMTRTRKRTYLEPGIKVLRIVDDAENGESQKLNGVKIECQMETTKHRLTFELHTADIGPEEMANTFISEDLLAERHRQILVDQLVDIVRQLREDPTTLPKVTFPPNGARSNGSPPHKEEEGKEQQKDEKDEEMNNVPDPTPLRSSEAVSSIPRNGSVKIEVPCATTQPENKQKMRMQTFEDVSIALIMICYLYVTYGMLWEPELEHDLVNILKFGMGIMSLVVLMVILDKLWLFCKLDPGLKLFTIAPLWLLYITALPLCFGVGLSLISDINNKQLGKGLHLFFVSIVIPWSLGTLPVYHVHQNLVDSLSAATASCKLDKADDLGPGGGWINPRTGLFDWGAVPFLF